MKKKLILSALFCTVLILLTGCKHFCTHEYEPQITTPASCTHTGVLTYTCHKCNDFYTEPIALEDHRWDTGVVQTEATCTELGVLLHTCEGCSTTRTEEIPLVPHTLDAGITTKEPTCAEPGSMEFMCTVCQQKSTEEIPTLEHTFGEPTITKDANCSQQGELSVTCTLCSHVQFHEYIPTNDTHVFENTVIKPSTCNDPGEGIDTCNLCGHSQSCTYALKPHSYGEKSVTKEPGCDTAGYSQATCKNCGYTKEEEIAATGHTWGEASCNEPITCQVCHYTDYNGIGHKYSLFMNIAPSQYMAGRRVYHCDTCGKGYDEYFDNYAIFDAEALRNHGYRYASSLGFNLAYSRDARDEPDYSKHIDYHTLQDFGGIPYLPTVMENAIDRLYEEYADSPAGISAYNIYIEVGYGQSIALGSGSFGIRLYLVW